MMAVCVEDFQREVECIYDDERYSVRDNGAIFRHSRPGKRPRPNDNKWTFGVENTANAYLHISSVRIHRIVATAFHGAPPDPKYVVDHIDSNCRNNRPENLRWLTRLENALNNPVTRKKIEYLCGSIEAFLENPSMLNELQGEPNFTWMRSVTREEANNCLARMTYWANTENKPRVSATPYERKGTFGERAYQPLQKWEVGFGREPGLDMALTPWCAQYMWRAAAYFPCCPRELGADPIADYFNNLKAGNVFAYSEDVDFFPKLSVFEAKILKEKSSIVAICERADSQWLVVGIDLDDKSKHFIHFGLGLFSSKREANVALLSKNESTNFWSEGYANQRNI